MLFKIKFYFSLEILFYMGHHIFKTCSRRFQLDLTKVLKSLESGPESSLYPNQYLIKPYRFLFSKPIFFFPLSLTACLALPWAEPIYPSCPSTPRLCVCVGTPEHELSILKAICWHCRARA